jgi:hypothetical protein
LTSYRTTGFRLFLWPQALIQGRSRLAVLPERYR